jgi:hypothetical protein
MSDAEDHDEVPADDDGAADVTLAKLTVPQIEQTVGALSTAISRDQLLTWLGLSHVLLNRAKEIRRRVEEAAIDWIKVHGQVECGPITYSVGHQKKVTCRDIARCLNVLLEACGGDVDELCRLLRSDPFRYGECAKVLGDARWNSVFQVDWSDKLVLKQVDSRFLPQPRGGDAVP